VCHGSAGMSNDRMEHFPQDFLAQRNMVEALPGTGGGRAARHSRSSAGLTTANRRQRNGILRMSDQEQAELRLAVARLKQEHADFDAAIEAMIETGCDALRIQRMKKKKLAIKDKLTELEDKIIPDIIA